MDFSPEEKSPAKEASKNCELEVNSNSQFVFNYLFAL